jgi:hypothetical protein
MADPTVNKQNRVFDYYTLSTVQTGEVAGSITAVVLPSIECEMVNVKAQGDNAGNVYLGTSSSATVCAGTTDITSGFQLDAGQETGWLPITNLNKLYIICDNAGDDICYIALSR